MADTELNTLSKETTLPVKNVDESPEVADDSGGKKKTCIVRFFQWDGALLVLSLCGAALGFAVGFAMYYSSASAIARVWVGLPGEMYMRMLKAAVLPLIVSSIIAGTAGLKPKENGRVGAVALTYMIITNIIGGIVGTVLAVVIKPGANGIDITDTTTVDTGNLKTSDLFADLIRNLVPDNVVAACFQKSQTRYRESSTGVNTTELVRYLDTASGTNILGLVIVCAAVGMSAAQTGEAARPFLRFFAAAAEIVFRVMQWIIWLTPIGVASLIAKAIASTTNLEATFKSLGLFVLAEVIGDLIVGIVIVSVLYLIFIRKNPFTFLGSTARAFITVMATASSTVAMPEMLNCLEQRNNVDRRVSRFIIPMTTALNRDGSTMFIACTSVYIAQLNGHTGASDIILITILAAVGSLAIPGVPSASIVTVLMILASLDIPPGNLGIIMALEWFSDRMRSSANMTSHVLCTIIAWHFCKKSLGPGDDSTPSPTTTTQQQP